MAGCPYRNFKECPQHNKKGGCEFWLSYASHAENGDAKMEGCAVVLTPILLAENAHALGMVAGEVNKVGHEVSAGRTESVNATAFMAHAITAVMHGQPMPTLEVAHAHPASITAKE